MRLRFHYSVFKCLTFHCPPFSDDLEQFPLFRLRQARLAQSKNSWGDSWSKPPSPDKSRYSVYSRSIVRKQLYGKYSII